MKVDDIKPRKEKNLDSIENTCDDEIKDSQRMRAFIMKNKTNKRNMHRNMLNTSLYLTLKLLLEGYKRIIRSHRSWVIKMLESKQENN